MTRRIQDSNIKSSTDLGGDKSLLPNASKIYIAKEDNDLETVIRKNNFAGTAAPVAGDDTADGYEPGSVWVDTTNDKAYVCLDATAAAAVWTETTQSGGGGGGGAPETIVFADERSAEGGAAVAGYNTRLINTTEGSVSWASSSSNQFTLDAGTYFIHAWAVAFRHTRFRSVLYDITGNAIASPGSMMSDAGGAGSSSNVYSPSHVTTVFTIGASNTYELRTAHQTARVVDGLGASANGSGTGLNHPTRYSAIIITKLA